jgi:hypothetical protein
MYVAGVVALTTLWSDGLAARVWNLQSLRQVPFLPEAVVPVFKQVSPTALVLRTARIRRTPYHSTLLYLKSMMAYPKSINFRTWCHRNTVEASVS